MYSIPDCALSKRILTDAQIYYGQNIGSGGQRVNPWVKGAKDEWPDWPPESTPGGPRYTLNTPRRLRVNLEGSLKRQPFREGYDPLFYKEGEMGEIIEWLIYGFLSYIYLDGDPHNYYRVVCWGSNKYQGNQQIRFQGYVGTKLFTGRPPVRMNGDQIRKFIAKAEEEEAIYMKAEKEARRVYATEIVRVSKAEANALADAERIKCYQEAGKESMPELFRLRPKNVFLEETVLNEGVTPGTADAEMADSTESSDTSEDEMEIDLPSDADSHYISRKIPKGKRSKRYHECIHRINAEKRESRKRYGPRARMRMKHNNPNQAPALQPGVPSSIFQHMTWESLRLILALCLPAGGLWIFRSDLYWIEKEGASLRWDLLLIVYVCCLSLPSHITRRVSPWASRLLVQYGQRVAFWLAFALYWEWPRLLGLSLGGRLYDVFFWGFLCLGLWQDILKLTLILWQGSLGLYRKWFLPSLMFLFRSIATNRFVMSVLPWLRWMRGEGM